MCAWAGIRLGVIIHNWRPPVPPPSRGPQMRVEVIDVGEGSSELLTVDTGGAMLIDAGPDGPGGDAVAATVGNQPIDLVLLSSTRERCIAGLTHVIGHINIRGPVLLPCSVHDFLARGGAAAANDIEAMHQHGIKAYPYDQYLLANPNPLGANCPVQIAGVQVVTRSTHHISLAVRVEYGESALLYAAGLNAEDEDTLLTRDANLDCDVFTVPDGGSENTALPEMLAQANAQDAVISCDSDDPPDPETLSWLDAANLHIDRTDRLSTFTLSVDLEADRSVLLRGTRPEKTAKPAA